MDGAVGRTIGRVRYLAGQAELATHFKRLRATEVTMLTQQKLHSALSRGFEYFASDR